MSERLRLGVNIDHVATLRNARGTDYPDVLRAAGAAAEGGADSITVHLREDRRHIVDGDVTRLIADGPLPVNLEMAATDEMRAIALELKPAACCLVPERRQELTTEGGLDAASAVDRLGPFAGALCEAGIAVALFVDPDAAQLEAAQAIGVPAIELHTGAYCDATGLARKREFARLAEAARRGAGLGLEIHAGHGLTFDSAAEIAAIPEIVEFNIGHFLVSEAVFTGLAAAVRRMRGVLSRARAGNAKARA